MRTCTSESRVGFELPRSDSIARPFPLWSPVEDPVILITTVSGPSDSPKGLFLKDSSGEPIVN